MAQNYFQKNKVITDCPERKYNSIVPERTTWF